ncbi:uncharacterized protein LOC115725245 isoform X3 [Cannabis sativa]|uniref:uncharacterized protein LOC115725245 isoform X3 n=1 Tax=Cannabis sativa TaxID=3483 RepID=UPI0011E04F4C|nr:uncharacterized protein LOC115725245 isoform X3 [Cannabis sativa]XP_060973272.1 uncharacterized protein LOC115725245 isoform X3 [Cannabis sativa]
MLENPSNAAVAAATESATIVKRYAPPNQRSRLHRRKSADKNQVSGSRSVPVIDHGDAGGSSLLNEKPRTRLIALEGCSSSEASQLLNERWAATMQFYNDSTVEQPEKPVMCSDKASSAWGGQFRLPHQFMTPTGRPGSPGSQMDFLGELRRAISNFSASFDS